MHYMTPTYRDVPRGPKLPQVLPHEAGNIKASWRERAACRDDADGLFLDEYDPQKVAGARKICAECPVADWCLADALSDRESMGVRAGFVFIMGGLYEKSLGMLKLLYGVKGRPVPSIH